MWRHRADLVLARIPVGLTLRKGTPGLPDTRSQGIGPEFDPDLEEESGWLAVERSEPPVRIGLEGWGLAALDRQPPGRRKIGKLLSAYS